MGRLGFEPAPSVHQANAISICLANPMDMLLFSFIFNLVSRFYDCKIFIQNDFNTLECTRLGSVVRVIVVKSILCSSSIIATGGMV